MSNKHSGKPDPTKRNGAETGHAAEYRIIKHDLIKVLVLNVVYLGVVLSLYAMNGKNGSVDAWFARMLRF